MQVGICGWGGGNKFPAAASRADGPLTQSYNILTKKTPLSLSVREELTQFLFWLFSKAGGELTTEQLGGMNTNCSLVLPKPEPEPEVKEEAEKEEEEAGEEEEGDEEEEEEVGEEGEVEGEEEEEEGEQDEEDGGEEEDDNALPWG